MGNTRGMRGITWFFFLSSWFWTAQLCSQQGPPMGIYYEGVLSLVYNAPIEIQLQLLDEQNRLVYAEFHHTSTDALGGFSLVMGQGTREEGVTKDFKSIDWSQPYRLYAIWRERGQEAFQLLEEMDLLSVPYAFYAFNAGSSEISDAYEAWLLDGGQGSLEEFIATFKGPRGEDGAKGERGEQGPSGEPGALGFLPPGIKKGAGVYWSGSEWVVGGDFFMVFEESMALGGEIIAQAQLALQAYDKGFLPPRMGLAARNAIPNPAEGLMIFNLDSGCPNYYSGGEWKEWCGKVGMPAAMVDSLWCEATQFNGRIVAGEPLVDVFNEVKYTGGNGGIYSSFRVESEGASGLFAAVNRDTIGDGEGWMRVDIGGFTPEALVAYFPILIGGKTCVLRWEVEEPVLPAFPDQTVHCDPNLPTRTINVLSPHTGKVWMDRNLGASRAAKAFDDSQGLGDAYQWGRFSDGHQCRESGISLTLSSKDRPEMGLFILSNAPPFDWRSPGNDQLWQGLLGSNNPCPQGYRLPTESEWMAEVEGWDTPDFKGAMSSHLALPLPGFRYSVDGAVLGVGRYGYYWTSHAQGNQSKVLMLAEGLATFIEVGRSYGMSVRCTKD
jgi:uncharacterized protein (TIGR02145 family)